MFYNKKNLTELKAKWTSKVLTWQHITLITSISIILSFVLSKLIRERVKLPIPYSQFVVGSATWYDGSKIQDFTSIYFFILFFISSWGLLSLFFSRNKNKFSLMMSPLFIALIPGAYFLLGLTSNYYFSEYLNFSAALVILVLVALFTFQKAFPDDNNNGIKLDTWLYFHLIIAGLLIPITATLFSINTILKWKTDLAQKDVFYFLLLCFLFLFSCLAIFLNAENKKNILRKWMVATITLLQILCPISLIYFFTPHLLGASNYFFKINHIAVVVSVFVFINLIDLYRRTKKVCVLELSLTKAISPFSIFYVLFFIKTPDLYFNEGWWGDDYHFGEWVLPYFLSKKYGILPHWDYAAARGLVNYIPQMFSDLFYSGNADMVSPMNPFVYFAYLCLGYFGISYYVGTFAAAASVLFFPAANGLSEIDLITTSALCFLLAFYRKLKFAHWLILFAIISFLVVFFAPAQGALFVVAFLPMVLITFYNQLKKNGINPFKTTIAFIALLLVSLFFTDLGKITLGAIRYVLENGEVNTAANGIPWSLGATDAYIDFKRSLFIFVISIIALFTLSGLFLKSALRSKQVIILGSIFLIWLGLFTIRAAGRIDPGGMTRLGVASIWCVATLGPIFFFIFAKRRYYSTIAIVTAIFAALLSPSFNSLKENPNQLTFTSPFFDRKPNEIIPNLGVMKLNPDHLDRLMHLKKTLSILLNPNETYIDLTNRNAQNYYLNYYNPMESGAFYNLPNYKHQIRSIEAISKTNPKVFLLESDNIVHDGGPLSFRAFWIYDYVMHLKGYSPVILDGYTYWMTKEKLDLISTRSLLSNVKYKILEKGSESDITNHKKLPPIKIEIKASELTNYFPGKKITLNGQTKAQVIELGPIWLKIQIAEAEKKNTILAENGFIEVTPKIDYTPSEVTNILHRIFSVTSLAKIPQAWGHSMGSLKNIMISDKIISKNILSDGSEKRIELNITNSNIDNGTEDVLVVQVSCGSKPPDLMTGTLYFQSSTDSEAVRITDFYLSPGNNILPVGSFPNWVRAENIKKIIIEKQSAFCDKFEVTSSELYKRKKPSNYEAFLAGIK